MRWRRGVGLLGTAAPWLSARSPGLEVGVSTWAAAIHRAYSHRAAEAENWGFGATPGMPCPALAAPIAQASRRRARRWPGAGSSQERPGVRAPVASRPAGPHSGPCLRSVSRGLAEPRGGPSSLPRRRNQQWEEALRYLSVRGAGAA